ncbi:MAG TPA: hypothetical protein PKN45_10755, partial [Candidatus Limiplasma sp.]|nr:hypothetical protein [Candidatus Limiplasma sp.]
ARYIRIVEARSSNLLCSTRLTGVRTSRSGAGFLLGIAYYQADKITLVLQTRFCYDNIQYEGNMLSGLIKKEAMIFG